MSEEIGKLRGEMSEEIGKLRVEAAEREARIDEKIGKLRVEAAEREARESRQVLTFAIGVIGINLAAVATAVGIILGFN